MHWHIVARAVFLVLAAGPFVRAAPAPQASSSTVVSSRSAGTDIVASGGSAGTGTIVSTISSSTVAVVDVLLEALRVWYYDPPSDPAMFGYDG